MWLIMNELWSEKRETDLLMMASLTDKMKIFRIDSWYLQG